MHKGGVIKIDGGKTVGVTRVQSHRRAAYCMRKGLLACGTRRGGGQPVGPEKVVVQH